MTIVWNNFPEVLSTPLNSANKNYNTREELEEITRKSEELAEVGFIEGAQNFMSFMSEWKAEGFWMAMYDKPFSEVAGDFFSEIGHATGMFLLGNGDLFFLMPALVFMVGTFMVGRNKYTKWIIPLWFLYFLSRAFYWIIQ